jgi:hypothetical protein
MKKAIVKRRDEYYGQVGEIIQVFQWDYAWATQYYVKMKDGAVLCLAVNELIRVGDWK